MADRFKSTFRRYGPPVLSIIVPIIVAVVFLRIPIRQFPQTAGQAIHLSPVNPIEIGGNTNMERKLSLISIHLSQGQEQPQEVQPTPQAIGTPLSPQEIERILSRLPTLETEATEQVDFKLAQDPIPPPRPGETILEPFPPQDGLLRPTPIPAGPLEVLRFSPEGEIPLAPFVNITFNQPMTALTTIAELAAQDVPVQIEPALPGHWRWQGARTLTFEYDSDLIDRLPKATEYRVTVPAGTRSATGGVLAEAVSWTFSTPPAVLTSSYPFDIPQPQDALFFAAFDQRIDPAVVLRTIRVTAGNQDIPLALASNEQIQADEQVNRLVKKTPEGRWLAFSATQPLPLDTTVSVMIGPGTPSAEGSLLTTQVQSYSFHTYAPLRVVDQNCRSASERCSPLQPFYVRFNNPLRSEQSAETLARIEPELPGAQIDLSGDTLMIQGASKGRTIYDVVFSKDIQDSFGQKLGQDIHLRFHVGPAEPTLLGPQQEFVTLDPTSIKPVFSVYAMNYDRLEVKIYAVQPSDWPAYLTYRRESARTDRLRLPPGRLVFDRTIRVDAPPDTLQEVGIDLSPALNGTFGHAYILVKPPQSDKPWQFVQAWVQATHIGFDAYFDHSSLLAWTTALKDGMPLEGVAIQAGPGGLEFQTDSAGLARLALPNGEAYLTARLGQDIALLPRSTSYWSDMTWSQPSKADSLRWYVFDDRKMYRPGEEIHLKGWLRRIGFGQSGDVELLGNEAQSVRYRVVESQGNEIGAGQAQVNALGGFDFVFSLPEKVNLGQARFYLDAVGSFQNLDLYTYEHAFQIQEFRRPEFEVITRAETVGPYFAGGKAMVSTQAKYYAGGPLPNAEVTWQVASSPGNYAPPNWPDFTFGTWRPWWIERGFFDSESFYGPGADSNTKYETFKGQTDASGKHYLQLDFESGGEPQPVSITAEATIMDVNRQAWTSRASLLVHPAELYVGLRSARYFVERGAPLKIDLIVTDLDGKAISGHPVEVRAARLTWKAHAGEWRQEEVDIQHCKLDSALEPVTCPFETPTGGEYRVTAVVTDDLGRKNQSQFTRWVSGGQLPPSRKVEQEEVTLIPDQESYQPGDTAHILVQSPFSPAEGLLTVSRSGVLYTQRFRLDEGSVTLEIPIEEAHIPNLHIQVYLVGAAARLDDRGEPLPGAPKRPAYAAGELNLSIPPLQRQLAVEVAPAQAELEPGGETTLLLRVKDAKGVPAAGTELSVVVVDEAILALSNYQLRDPLSIFYFERESGVESQYGRANLVLADPQALANTGQIVVKEAKMQRGADAVFFAAPVAMPAAADAAAPNATQPVIRVRMDFNPLAFFAPVVTTEANGEARIQIKLPDNLTRYRIMAVAVQGGRQFGTGEANLTARLPLMVRISPPRFLNFGDRFDLPVIIQNQTDLPQEVDVVAQVSNLELTGEAGLRVMVPARDRIEVRFPASTIKSGTATIRVVAASSAFTDAATVSLPVYTPATTEAFATYGVLDEGILVQPVAAVEGVFPQYGGLEVNTSSTALQALTDAVLYLVQYPFDCTEQIASRLLAIAALRDVLAAFEAGGMPSPAELEASVAADISMLQGLQNYDGGFPYWRLGADSIPFHTIHVAHALQRAKSKGFTVPSEMQNSALEYLRQIESHYPAWYGKQIRWTLSAYALYVRNLMDDRDPSKALRLIKEAGLENLSLDAIGWLWPVLENAPGTENELEAIRLQLNNRVVETAGAANFTTSYDDQNYLLLGSNRRTDAILLDAMIGDNPGHDLIPKLVNGLLAQRVKGRWNNTQENVFVLLAMDRYFNTYEAQTPDFVARLWLGETYVGSQEFRGRSTARLETDIPMNFMLDEAHGGGKLQNLILSKEGQGRLYYRIGLRYAPTDLQQDPLDRGFVVQRRYEGLDNPQDVTQDENGAWRIKSGARVRVRLTMIADNRRYHVALVDPLPAGLEIVNPALAVSSQPAPDTNPSDRRYGWWWWGTWYEHQNLRDERAEAFTSLLWDGVYEYSYIARATTPGTFVVPPAKAEEMYSPEVFGRSASDIVIVR